MITKVSVWLNCSYRSEIKGFQVSAPVKWGERDHENLILELPKHSLRCLLLLNDSNQWCTVQIYMAQKFLPEAKDGTETLLLLWGFSSQNASQCDSERKKVLWDLIFGSWNLSHRIWSHAMSEMSAFELLFTLITILWEGSVLVVQIEEFIFYSDVAKHESCIY